RVPPFWSSRREAATTVLRPGSLPRSCRLNVSRDHVERAPRPGVGVDLDDVLQLAELGHDLRVAPIVGDQEQDGAASTILERDAENALDVESAPGEQAAQVRHDAGMVADDEPQDRLLSLHGSLRRSAGGWVLPAGPSGRRSRPW